MNNNKLWYDKEAAIWDEALPLGNGKISAMVYGASNTETICLNSEDFFAGGPVEDLNAPYKNLGQIRNLIFDNNQPQAEKIIETKMSGDNTMAFEPLSFVHINFGHDNVTDYKRSLDISRAIAYVEYNFNNIMYKREMFISSEYNCIMMRISSDNKNVVSFAINVDSPLRYFSRTLGNNVIYTNAKCPDVSYPKCEYTNNHGMNGVTLLKINNNGGSITSCTGSVFVSNADYVDIFISCETSYVSYNKKPIGDAYANAVKVLEHITSYDEVLARHISDYTRLFDRVSLCLGDEKKEPTDKRLEAYKNDDSDLGLIELYFNFGRYLQITSSYACEHASNLQGIWNEKINPQWQSSYTVNINTQMNYWMAEICNLSECHMPLFKFIKAISDNGTRTAMNYYNCKGWCSNHNIDIWAKTSPFTNFPESSRWGMWPMSGIWLCLHIFEHFKYTNDMDFLSEYYEIISKAAEFLLDWMVEYDGQLVTCPSTSPENSYINEKGEHCSITYSATMDVALIKEFLTEFIKATKLLNKENPVADKCIEALDKIPDYQIDKNGCLQEWIKEYEEIEPGHRHLSHLLGVYPGRTITYETTPEFFVAAKASLKRRIENGGGHTGWSAAWIVNLYASFFDGNNAWAFLKKMMTDSTYPNLFDKHPPFQIDGNFGASAAIARMLMQSTNGIIKFLPALPCKWQNGKIEGLRAEGGFTLGVHWINGELDYGSITSDRKQACKIHGKTFVTNNGDIVACVYNNNITEFETEQNNVYTIRRSES